MLSLQKPANACERTLGYSFAQAVLKLPSDARPRRCVTGLTTSSKSWADRGRLPLLYINVVGLMPAAPYHRIAIAGSKFFDIPPRSFFFRHAPVADIHSKTKEVLGHQGIGRNMVLDSTLACSYNYVFILEVVSMIISMGY